MDLVHVTGRSEPEYRKISKPAAGYVYRAHAEYRCRECVNFLSDIGKCFLFGEDDKVSEDGYCTLWSPGSRPGDDHDWDDKPQGCYKPSELAYGTKANGTLCRRCVHFDGDSRCEIVEGVISAGGCCNSQTPKVAK